MMINYIESNANTPAHEFLKMTPSTSRQTDHANPNGRRNFTVLAKPRLEDAGRISSQTKCGSSTFEDRVQQAFDLVEDDYEVAMKAISGEKARRMKSYREAEYISAASAFFLAGLLDADDDLWDTFRKEAIWKGRALDRKCVLRLALMYMYGAVAKSELDRARDHARALQSLWEDGTRATTVAERLRREGGFNAFKKNSKKRKGAAMEDLQRRGVSALTFELSEQLVQVLEVAPLGKTFHLSVSRERSDGRTRFVARRTKSET